LGERAAGSGEDDEFLGPRDDAPAFQLKGHSVLRYTNSGRPFRRCRRSIQSSNLVEPERASAVCESNLPDALGVFPGSSQARGSAGRARVFGPWRGATCSEGRPFAIAHIRVGAPGNAAPHAHVSAARFIFPHASRRTIAFDLGENEHAERSTAADLGFRLPAEEWNQAPME